MISYRDCGVWTRDAYFGMQTHGNQGNIHNAMHARNRQDLGINIIFSDSIHTVYGKMGYLFTI